MQLYQGRPADMTGRQDKEKRVYELLDRLGIAYERVDHEAAETMEACEEIDKFLAPAVICKNLFLCNTQKTKFYLLMIRGDKKFKTKEISSQIHSARLSFAPAEKMEEYLDKVGKLNFNSITISPTYVSLAKEKLADSTTKISTVVGFPLGFETAEGKIAQAAKALEDGADEIESVINLNHLKDHKYNLIHEELKQLRELLGDKTLKVIVEMQTIDDSEKASIAKVLEENKVDFIKTSTGFIAPDNIYSKVNDINIIQKYAPQLKIEIYGGVDTYKLANQLLTGGADLIGSNCGYEIVEKYRTLRENTQVTPKPIRFD